MSIWTTQKAIGELREAMTELRLEIAHLQSANKQLGLEWEELYDKVRRQMARMSKRVAVDAKEAGNGMEDVAGQTDDEVDPISAKILARRGFIRRQAE